MTHDHRSSRSTDGRVDARAQDHDPADADHDRESARRSSLADLRRYASTPQATPNAAKRADGKQAPLQVGPGAEASHETKAARPALPVAHGSREIKIEFGEGTVTGGITATLEYGKTGVPLGPDQIKALENTSAVQLNGLKTKLETAILNGELEGDLLEGLKVSIEANALKAGVDSDGDAEVDLMTITVKLLGDAGHLLNAGADVKLTIDGNLTIALGGKLAAQLSSFTVAQLEQQMLAKEMSEIGDHLDDNVRRLKDLEAKADLLESRGSFAQAQKLREEAFQHRLKISTGNQQLDGLRGKLKAAKARANKAIGALQGKVAKQVAKAMEKRAIKFVATKLMKLVPILNLVSTVIDVVELIGMIKNLIEGDFGGAADDTGKDNDKHKDAADGAEPRKDAQTPAGDASRSDATGSAARDGTAGNDAATGLTKEELSQTRQSLAPAARAVVDVLMVGDRGARLSADHIKMIGLLVPQDLTTEQLTELLTMLREPGGKARTAEEVIEAVSTAVRAIKNRNSTVKINGESRSDLAISGAHEKDVEHAAGSGGPVTSPSQVNGPTRAMDVIRGGDAATIGSWFKAEGKELVWTPAGEAWRRENVNTEIASGTELTEVESVITNAGDEKWDLRLRFRLRDPQGDPIGISHRFVVYVGGETDGIGAKVGSLKFEGIVVIE